MPKIRPTTDKKSILNGQAVNPEEIHGSWMAESPKPHQLVHNGGFTTGAEFLWHNNRCLSGCLIFKPYFASIPNNTDQDILKNLYGRDSDINARQQFWRGLYSLNFIFQYNNTFGFGLPNIINPNEVEGKIKTDFLKHAEIGLVYNSYFHSKSKIRLVHDGTNYPKANYPGIGKVNVTVVNSETDKLVKKDEFKNVNIGNVFGLDIILGGTGFKIYEDMLPDWPWMSANTYDRAVARLSAAFQKEARALLRKQFVCMRRSKVI
ncbi:MAG: hypothetical protein F6J98_01715 [Moorea sp. SIO4G2]|nr:hypothetical protein [Moorena sp. SIO4G2]